MVKLKVPLYIDSRMIPAGEEIALPGQLEALLLEVAMPSGSRLTLCPLCRSLPLCQQPPAVPEPPSVDEDTSDPAGEIPRSRRSRPAGMADEPKRPDRPG